jgi:mycothiol synthase
MAGFGFWVMPCPPESRGAALEVLYRRLPAVLRDEMIQNALEESRRGEIDLSGLWVARTRAGRIMAALLTQPLAGKTAAFWAPEVRPSWRRSALTTALIKEALADLKARGFRLAQAMLDQSAGPRVGRDLERGGMPQVTELLYLERDTATPLSPRPRAPVELAGAALSSRSDNLSSPRSFCDSSGFEWRPFEAALECEFRATLQATYTDSLDMPELEGARSLDDIMEGHRAAGRFMADRWQLGRIPGKPEAAAVLLLAEIPGRNVWEVIYLGLTPSARGCGLGIAVLQHALDLAQGHVDWLELAVDRRNTPALRLYEDAGFVVRDRRAVHLAIFPTPP